MPAQDIATGHYLQPAVMTAPGQHQPLLADLPQGIASLAAVAHGLLIHEHITGPYGVTLTDERRASVHVRPVAGLLARMMAEDGRPLTVAREPASRLTRVPDAAFADLTVAYADDPRLHVPPTVYNGVLNRAESVLDEDRGPKLAL
jgi:hypothetical protein